jgi:hypothetical protein
MMSIRGFFRRFINDGQFDKPSQWFYYDEEDEKFVPTEKIKSNKLPLVFMFYEVTTANEELPIGVNEKACSMVLVQNGKPVEPTKKNGRIYKYSSGGNNDYYEKDVRYLLKEAARLSKTEEPKQITETTRASSESVI